MEKKYTHGPWVVDHNGLGALGDIGTSDGEVCVAQAQQIQGDDLKQSIRECNAHLIAAAPDLLEGLEVLLQAVCGETGFANAVRTESGLDYPWPALDIAESAARAAIRKAYGEGV